MKAENCEEDFAFFSAASSDEEENLQHNVTNSQISPVSLSRQEDIRQAKAQLAKMQKEEQKRNEQWVKQNSLCHFSNDFQKPIARGFRRSVSHQERSRTSLTYLKEKQKDTIFRINSMQEEEIARLEMKLREEKTLNSSVRQEMEEIRKTAQEKSRTNQHKNASKMVDRMDHLDGGMRCITDLLCGLSKCSAWV